ncbi:MAG: fasciclin domain-containing protein [Salinibacter sp.]
MRTLLRRLSLLAVAGLLLMAGPVAAQDMGDTPDIVDTAVQADGFDTLVKALKAAELVGALKGEGPFTVFAPTDEAFEALPDERLKSLLQPENREQLRSILRYHVVSGKAMASDVTGMSGAETLQGQSVQFQVKNGTVTIMGRNSATVVKPDIEASNGVIHVVDSVLLPPMEDGGGM